MIRNFSLLSIRIKNRDRFLRFERMEISMGIANIPSIYLGFSTFDLSIDIIPFEKLSIIFCRFAAARPVCFSLKNRLDRVVRVIRFSFSLS